MDLLARRALDGARFKRRIAWLVAALSSPVLTTSPARAQDEAEPSADGPADRETANPADAAGSAGTESAEIAELRQAIEDLKEENSDLKEDVEDLFREQQKPVVKPKAQNLLNPLITVFANGAARIDNRTVLSDEGIPIDDKLFLRTVEFDFRAAIDPFADGVVSLALEDEAGTGFEADLEEGYLVLKRLPILESAPLGLKLKIGRFRAPIGASNRMHLHDLPWTTRPLPIVTFLGTEQGAFFESGFNPEGIDAEFLLPEIVSGAVIELNLDVVNAHGIALTEGAGGWNTGLLAHLNLFFNPGEAHDVNLGLSSYYEGGRRRTGLFAADFFYKWKPQKAGEFRSLVLGGELFYARRRFEIDPEMQPDVLADSAPFGAFAFAQYQLSFNLYAGARYDFSQEIANDDLATHVLAAYASYYTSEFLRFRVGYEHRRSDIAMDDGLHSAFFEMNFVIGSHPIEPYWVNR